MIQFAGAVARARALRSACVLCALLTAANSNAQTVGRTDGRGAVTSDGAAAYEIPVWVAPGNAGMQPDLTIAYNSKGGPGWLGVGWNLAGLSQIVLPAHVRKGR